MYAEMVEVPKDVLDDERPVWNLAGLTLRISK
jgi:hypothetical protein